MSRAALTAVPDRPQGAGDAGAWERAWAKVPDAWAGGVYEVNAQPYAQVFAPPGNARTAGTVYDLRPDGHPRLGQEAAWWVYTCYAEGLRKIDPWLMAVWRDAVSSLAATRRALTGRTAVSVAEFAPQAVVAEAVRAFTARRGRAPSAARTRNLFNLAEHVRLLVAVRCGGAAWWEHDVWDLRVDVRIPRREHEPSFDDAIHLDSVQPSWLREGLRFYLRSMLINDVYTWSTAVKAAKNVGYYFGRFVAENGYAQPAITAAPDKLRPVFLDLLSFLRSPDATKRGKPMSENTVAAIQSQVQLFYTFMLENAPEAAAATGDPRWCALGEPHARLWAVQFRNRRSRRGRGRSSEPRFIGPEDVSRMLAHLELLGAPTTAQVTIERPGLQPLTARGLGDAQAMRAWLLQAMTGRRASEILMLDFQPLTALPDIDLEAAGEDDFVARLRYQQTKIDGVDPTILVERSVVNIIAEQQAYAAARFPGAALRYLFPALRHNHQGLIARTYKSYRFALRRLDKLVGLSDSVGAALSYTHTHRLRHTRATELINAGVPLHVVQRYLGHRSPEMTLHYAATLAATAEAQFLKFKKVGSDGRELALSGRDLFDMIALDKRTDRVLPNGWCLLPPTKTCEKGNACLPCGHFATDATHRDELDDQRRRTLKLVEVRQGQHAQRHGTPMGEDNIWLTGRRREIASLDAIIARLDQQTDGQDAAVRGAGAPGRNTATDQEDQRTPRVAG